MMWACVVPCLLWKGWTCGYNLVDSTRTKGTNWVTSSHLIKLYYVKHTSTRHAWSPFSSLHSLSGKKEETHRTATLEVDADDRAAGLSLDDPTTQIH